MTVNEMIEAIIEESGQAAEHGIMSVFTQVNLAPEQEPRATQAYGNRTGASHKQMSHRDWLPHRLSISVRYVQEV